ncbi:glycosyltransferase [Cytobacillus sp. FSL K6-0265]|uniref:glycosyltransferase n=1 Tax=Cytobacillus sp. FSL K6-0265 TaxID=2921448 RepID=UPI0030F857AC
MKIGFVSTWLERGATYVTKTYMSLLDDHELYVYARGGEKYERNNPKFANDFVTWGLRLGSTKIDWKHFSYWIKENQLDAILFNEQTDLICVLKTKKYFPKIKIGAYIDYYTEGTVDEYKVYDFLICNTKRHYSVFEWHKGAYYVPWGTNLDIFEYDEKPKNNSEIKFFHSMGMSGRKGTNSLVKAFINGKFYEKNAKLIIHSQVNIEHIIKKEEAQRYNIEIVIKEVPPPGLYHLGDVYVYPTILEGLGLTIYEALACGLPVITTDNPPMNEVVNEKNGRLVDVELLRARKDGYYWPSAFVNEQSLINSMNYYCDNRKELNKFKKDARDFAEFNHNIMDRKEDINKIFEKAPLQEHSIINIDKWIKKEQNKQKNLNKRTVLEILLPNKIKHVIRANLEEKRFGSN